MGEEKTELYLIGMVRFVWYGVATGHIGRDVKFDNHHVNVIGSE